MEILHLELLREQSIRICLPTGAALFAGFPKVLFINVKNSINYNTRSVKGTPNIVITGFTSCGKSQAGRVLSSIIDYKFIDLDDFIENLYYAQNNLFMTCRQIYELKGETFFRELEFEAVKSVFPITNTVISTGGGIVRNKKNREILSSLGKIIYLKTSSDVIYRRMMISKGAPAFMADNHGIDEVEQALDKMNPLYEELADIVIDNDKTAPLDTAKEIISALNCLD